MTKENFFDFREKLQAKPQATSKKADPLTVSQLTAQIERAIKSGVPGTIYVKGEASNCNLHRASGHLYFTLKDEGACIDCVMFRSDVSRLKFTPKDGIELLVGGRVAIYPQRGRYQLYATTLSPLGQGALELAFQQLCEKLRKQGLFEPDRKKPLPEFPARIAIITSRATAALQDILKVLRRFPFLRLFLYHVPVQGDGSAEQIADAIIHLNRFAGSLGGVDVILLARGGGSLEDLWEFNEEVVARAMAGSKIPIITGIGHEMDVSVADLVADYHAHTPTEAAQVVTAQWKNAAHLLSQSHDRINRAIRNTAQDARHRLIAIRRHEFFRRPTDRINQLRQLLDDRHRSLQHAAGARLHSASSRLARIEALMIQSHPRYFIALKRQSLSELAIRLSLFIRTDLRQRGTRLDSIQRHLEAISPKSILNRGYTITTHRKTSEILRSAKDARIGDRLLTRFADGTVESTVQDQNQLPLFE